VVAVVRRSPYVAAFGSLTLTAFFWMMGTHTLPGRLFFPFFFDLVHDSVYVEFTMVVFSLGIAVLAGLGANSLLRRPLILGAVIVIYLSRSDVCWIWQDHERDLRGCRTRNFL